MDAAGFSLWFDGNVDSATLSEVTSRDNLATRAGIAERILAKYDMPAFRWKLRARKDEVLGATLCAIVEAVCAGYTRDYPFDVDLYLLQPPGWAEARALAPVLRGPRPSNQYGKRSLYRQIVIASDASVKDEVQMVGELLGDSLRIRAPPEHQYGCFEMFCKDAVHLMQVIRRLDAADCAEYLCRAGYAVRDYHWKKGEGPFNWLRDV
jgi:hypothetical protein